MRELYDVKAKKVKKKRGNNGNYFEIGNQTYKITKSKDEKEKAVPESEKMIKNLALKNPDAKTIEIMVSMTR